MQRDHTSIETMRAYLLGRLSEDEASALEQEYFLNRPFLLKLQSEETTLIEDYLDGSLGPEEKQSFEKQYLQLPELSRKVDEVKRQRRAIAQTTTAKPPIWANWRFSFAAALVLVLGVGIWIYHAKVSDQLKQAAHEQTPVQPKPLDQASKHLAAIFMYLSPGRTKGASAATEELLQPAAESTVILVLELPGEPSPVKRTVQIFMVKADGGLSQVWASPESVSSISGMNPSDGSKTSARPSLHQVIRVALSGSLFQPGDYVVQASLPKSGTHETYLYRVLPRENSEQK